MPRPLEVRRARWAAGAAWSARGADVIGGGQGGEGIAGRRGAGRVTPGTAVRRRGLSVSDPVPLILLPGMAADGRLFAPQRAAFPQLVVPAWIDPLPRESLRAYAARLARRVDPGRPC